LEIIRRNPEMFLEIGSPADEQAFQVVINNLNSKLYSIIEIK
jgi:hypothetical protein